MIAPGLVSITFRQLGPEEIVDLVCETGLRGIEWGGDVHVPHGDRAAARRVRELTGSAGLEVAAYGSYYRVGASEKDGLSFEDVLASAMELGAPSIRVWAGKTGSAETAPDARSHIVEEARRIADLAAGAEITIAFEFHRNTLTDTNGSAATLLDEVNHPNVFSLWQPPVGMPEETCLEGIRTILPLLTNVHVYSWSDDSPERLFLEERAGRWKRYLETVDSAGGDRFALIEFVRDNEPKNFLKDAATLKSWLNELPHRAE